MTVNTPVRPPLQNIHEVKPESFIFEAPNALPVDICNEMIRRFEAKMTGAVPLPLILKSIPVYKLRRVKHGEWWVVSDAYVQAELRRIPLLKIPGSVTLHFRTRDHVINGVAYPDAEVR